MKRTEKWAEEDEYRNCTNLPGLDRQGVISESRTALHDAAGAGNTERIKSLLRSGAETERLWKGQTALHIRYIGRLVICYFSYWV